MHGSRNCWPSLILSGRCSRKSSRETPEPALEARSGVHVEGPLRSLRERRACQVLQQPERGRLWFNNDSCARLRAERKNHVWAYDFVHARTHDGRSFRIVAMVDEFTRECLAIDVARHLNREDVLERLAWLMVMREVPDHIRSDNGPEFTASSGDTFDILDFPDLSGSFAATNLPVLDDGLVWDTSQLLVDGSLCACATPLPADFNYDGIVDGVDIDLLREAWHTNVTDMRFNVNGDAFINSDDFIYLVQIILGTEFGDGDLNKIVNFQDFVILANNYGTDLSSGVSAGTTVPEPTSLVLLSLAVSFVARRRGVDGR